MEKELAPIQQWPYRPKEEDDQAQLWPNGWVTYRHHGRYVVTQQGILSGTSLFRQICRMLKAGATVGWIYTAPEIVRLLVG